MIVQQFYNHEEDRLILNSGVGAYNSAAHRNTLSKNPNYYYVNLQTYFDQTHLAILNNTHHIQLRVYMDIL